MSKEQKVELRELRNKYFKSKDEVLESMMTISKSRENNFTLDEQTKTDSLVVFSGFMDLNAKFRQQI